MAMPRGLVFLMGALLLGGLATWLTAGWLERAAQANEGRGDTAIQTVRILVAATDLNPGDTMGRGMLTWQPWPQQAVRPEHLVEGVADAAGLSGAMVRVAVPKGAPLIQAHLVKRGDQGIMAALIAPGYRAVTIAVTAASGIAGFVGPGDRVDLLLTASIPGSGGNRILGQTVVDDVRVLGIDQRVEPTSAATLQDSANFSPPTTVTLEVTPQQAETIAVAQEIGKLSLSLRDLKAQQAGRAKVAAADPTVAGKTWDTDVTHLPASAFEATAAGLSMAAAASAAPVAMPMPASGASLGPSSSGPQDAAASAGGGGGDASAAPSVERVNGVEVVRGSSTRGASAGAPAAAAAPVAAQ